MSPENDEMILLAGKLQASAPCSGGGGDILYTASNKNDALHTVKEDNAFNYINSHYMCSCIKKETVFLRQMSYVVGFL